MRCFEFVDSNQAIFDIAAMCRLWGVSRSGYYAWAARLPSFRDIDDEVLTGIITNIHTDSKETYGYRRVVTELADDYHIVIGKHRVARLMRVAGLEGVSPERWVATTRRAERGRPAP